MMYINDRFKHLYITHNQKFDLSLLSAEIECLIFDEVWIIDRFIFKPKPCPAHGHQYTHHDCGRGDL